MIIKPNKEQLHFSVTSCNYEWTISSIYFSIQNETAPADAYDWTDVSEYPDIWLKELQEMSCTHLRRLGIDLALGLSLFHHPIVSRTLILELIRVVMFFITISRSLYLENFPLRVLERILPLYCHLTVIVFSWIHPLDKLESTGFLYRHLAVILFYMFSR